VTEFLKPLYPDQDEAIYLRAIKPRGNPDAPNNRPQKVRTTRRELASDRRKQEYLRNLNKTRGLYFVVNAGGDCKENIKPFNAVFAEADNISIAEQHRLLDVCSIQPSVRVETLKSVHAYWLIQDSCTSAEWIESQRRISRCLRSDTSLDDLPQLMRLPTFNHV